jgi:hypothetical protein
LSGTPDKATGFFGWSLDYQSQEHKTDPIESSQNQKIGLTLLDKHSGLTKYQVAI